MSFQHVAAGVACLGLWSLSGAVHAELIIEETFTGYPDNALISAQPAGPAIGLIDDWELTPNQDFYVNRTETDLHAGTGKAVYDREAAFNGARTARRSTSIDHVLFQNDGDVFYASFLIDPAWTSGDMTFQLGLTRLDGGGALDFVFGMGDGKYFVSNGGVNPNADGGLAIADEQLVLVRIEYGSVDSGPDDDEVVTLWVDPIDEFSMPVIDGVATDLLNRGGGKITDVSIRGDQMLGQPAFFDNLRVGTSFSAVAHGADVPLPGDFDADGDLDADDIDALSAALEDQSSVDLFDVNGDGSVDQADHTFWVKELKNTYFGDSDLDAEFDSGDLVAVFQAGEYEDAIGDNSGWAEGDWNGDGDFTSGDVVLAFQDGGFEQGPRPELAAVPEPHGIGMLTIALALAAVSSTRWSGRRF